MVIYYGIFNSPHPEVSTTAFPPVSIGVDPELEMRSG